MTFSAVMARPWPPSPICQSGRNGKVFKKYANVFLLNKTLNP